MKFKKTLMIFVLIAGFSSYFATDLHAYSISTASQPQNTATSFTSHLSSKNLLRSDRIKHFVGGFLLVTGSQLVLVKGLSMPTWYALPVSISIASAVGVGKEVYDAKQQHNYFDYIDLIADGLGMLLGIFVILVFRRVFKKSRKTAKE